MEGRGSAQLSVLTEHELSLTLPDWKDPPSGRRAATTRGSRRRRPKTTPPLLAETTTLAAQALDALSGASPAPPVALDASQHEERIREALAAQWRPQRPQTDRPPGVRRSWRSRSALDDADGPPALPLTAASVDGSIVPPSLRVVRQTPLPPSAAQAERFAMDFDEATGQWQVQLFPPRLPNSRGDVRVLDRWLTAVTDAILDRADQNGDAGEATGALSDVLGMALEEVARQVSVQCAERGELLRRLWGNQRELQRSAIAVGERERAALREQLDSAVQAMRAENERVLATVVEDMQERVDVLTATGANAAADVERLSREHRNAEAELQLQLSLHAQLQIEIERLTAALRDSEDRGHRVAARLAALQANADSSIGTAAPGAGREFAFTGRKIVAALEGVASFVAADDEAEPAVAALLAEVEDAFCLGRGDRAGGDERDDTADATACLAPVSAALDDAKRRLGAAPVVETASVEVQTEAVEFSAEGKGEGEEAATAGEDQDQGQDRDRDRDQDQDQDQQQPPPKSEPLRRRLPVDPQLPLTALLAAQGTRSQLTESGQRPLDIRTLRSEIASLYQGKLLADATDRELGLSPVSLSSFMLRYFIGLFGRKGLALRHLRRLQSGARQQRGDARVRCFARLAGMRTCCEAAGPERCRHQTEPYEAAVAGRAVGAIGVMVPERNALADAIKDPLPSLGNGDDPPLLRAWVPVALARAAALAAFSFSSTEEEEEEEEEEGLADVVAVVAAGKKPAAGASGTEGEDDDPANDDDDAPEPAPASPGVPPSAPDGLLHALQRIEAAATADPPRALLRGRLRPVAGLKVELEAAVEAIYDGLLAEARRMEESARLAVARRLQARWRGKAVRQRLERQRAAEAEAELRQLFNSHDENGDQVITFDEFCSMLGQLDARMPLAEQLELFVRLVEGSAASASAAAGDSDPEDAGVTHEDAIDIDVFCEFMQQQFRRHPLHGWQRVL